jgi:hypothetical protein
MQAQELTLRGNDASSNSHEVVAPCNTEDCSKTPTPKAKRTAAKAANNNNERL